MVGQGQVRPLDIKIQTIVKFSILMSVKYLGHMVGQGQVRPLDIKIQTIVKFSILMSQKELPRFPGMAGYYRNFCLNVSEIAAPQTNLLSKKVKFFCTDDCQLTKLSYYSKQVSTGSFRMIVN